MSLSFEEWREWEVLSTFSIMFNTSVIVTGTGVIPVKNGDGSSNDGLAYSNLSFVGADKMNLTLGTYHSMLDEFRGTLYTYKQPHNIVLICLYVPVFLLAFIGNLLVLCVVLPNKHMRSVTNCFIVNLAIADLLVTIVCVPMAIGQSVYRLWVYGSFMCKITSYMQGVSVASSVFTIMLLSMDRYLAIKHPMTFRTITAGRHAVKIVIIIWLVCFGIMIPLLLARKLDIIALIPDEPLYFCKESWNSDKNRQIYDVFLFLFMFIMPGYFIIVSYSQIGRQLWTESRDLCRSDSKVGKEQAEKVMAGRRRIARMLAFVAILFAVCWMPYHLLSLYIDFVKDVKNTGALETLPFTILIGHSNSALNPILYCFMSKTFRKNTLKLFRCTFHRHTSTRKKAKDDPVHLVIKYQKVNGNQMASVQRSRNPLRRLLSNSSTLSRSSGSLKFSRSSATRTSSLRASNNAKPKSPEKKPAPQRIEDIKTEDEKNLKQENNFKQQQHTQMDLLKQPERRSRKNKNKNKQRDLLSFNIPTTINEESTRISKSPSPRPNQHVINALIEEKNQSSNDFENEETCFCSHEKSICSCDCDYCKNSDSGQDSYGSDTFCETCADAGLVECCHITPEPKIRMALLRNLKAERGLRQVDVELEVQNIPKITLNQYE